MREIKFRAWDKHNKKMISNPTLEYNNRNWRIQLLNKWAVDGNFVMMQYTGFKDKKCVEIYEGDIVDIYGDGMYVHAIEWGEGGFCFSGNRDSCYGKSDIRYGLREYDAGAYFPVIIGNIYENEGLLNAYKTQ